MSQIPDNADALLKREAAAPPRSPANGVGGMPPTPLPSHQPSDINTKDSPSEWIHSGEHVTSDDHFNADPEAVLWGETAWLADATAKLKEVADAHFRRGEYAA